MRLIGQAGIIAGLAIFLLAGGSFAAEDVLAGISIKPAATRQFDRQRDFGSWDHVPSFCKDVRGMVLEAASEIGVTWSPPKSSRCRVISGRWHDPYTGQTITDASKMDIDHMVPLKEAFESGAYSWTKKKRHEYANYLGDPNHLIAVTGSANRSKSDRDPAKWMPPDATFKCKYLSMWLEVKQRWHLAMDNAEAAIVRDGLSACGVH